MENLIKVSKTTRASREGRLIFCPDCFNSQRVYHFAWAGLYCSNKDVQSSILLAFGFLYIMHIVNKQKIKYNSIAMKCISYASKMLL